MARTANHSCGNAGCKGAKEVSYFLLKIFRTGLKHDFRGNKRIAADDATEVHPQKRVRSKDVSTTKASSITSESEEDDVVMDTPPPARKRGVIIELVANPTLPTKRLNGNNTTRQGSFEDVNWETRRLETEDEKRAEWSKDTKKMQEERKADEIQKLTDQTERLQCQKDLARERQRRHRVLVKEQNPKPKSGLRTLMM
jgi:hypothetical protein